MEKEFKAATPKQHSASTQNDHYYVIGTKTSITNPQYLNSYIRRNGTSTYSLIAARRFATKEYAEETIKELGFDSQHIVPIRVGITIEVS